MKLNSNICVIFITFSIILSGCNTNNTTPKDKNTDIASISKTEKLAIKDYFPNQKNKCYKYKGEGNEFASYSTYIDYSNDDSVQIRKINDGTTSVSVYKIKSDSLEKVYSEGESYSRENFIGKNNMSKIILKLPFKVGSTWNEDENTKRTISNLNAPLKLSIGNFTALEVTVERNESITTEYYVKNMGLVKSIYKDNSNKFKVISELEKIQDNASFSQKTNIYYPDFTNERIIYESRTFNFLTNESPVYKFQKELKIPPTVDKNISTTFSPGVKILSIFSTPNKNLVTVDVSKEFVSEMNAGSTFEYLILSSLANTFGEYYNATKFNITVEGNQYSSGHIEIDELDYFDVKGIAK